MRVLCVCVLVCVCEGGEDMCVCVCLSVCLSVCVYLCVYVFSKGFHAFVLFRSFF